MTSFSPTSKAGGLRGQYQAFSDVGIRTALRTPWVDLNGALSLVSPTDLGIKVGREVLAAAGVDAGDVDNLVVGSVGPAAFDAYLLPRHIGLYSGLDLRVPALLVQRICGTGFEVLRQAADQVQQGASDLALCVATESMSRNPIAAFTHRNGFRLGADVEFKDFLWEALLDTAVGLNMIQTAERIASVYGLAREEVDVWAARSFERAVAAQARNWFDGEIVAVRSQDFEAEGCQPRGIRLPRGCDSVTRDSHIRASSLETLSRLNSLYPGGVQTAGNSCAVVDGAAAALVCRAQPGDGGNPLAYLRATAIVGVRPQVMGIGPVDAIRLLLERSGLGIDEIDRFEINEAQGAQILAVQQVLELNVEKVNVNGGAIAIGHPLAATGLRLSLTLARQLREANLRYGIAAACVGGGQGMALLLENPDYRP
ncbi:thiolase family protein [Marinobacterium rhizophilum]|uniref:thiolase family protein n=1 Tax=Marinobacterium rhizophilum TaxID=420402 RepID=UPI0003703CD8|nr:thiolase family protein [Marinobacterium rhizophilum]